MSEPLEFKQDVGDDVMLMDAYQEASNAVATLRGRLEGFVKARGIELPVKSVGELSISELFRTVKMIQRVRQ